MVPAEHELVASAVGRLGCRFIAQYEGLDRQLRAAFSDARFAFLEALGCAKNGNYLASAVMCRETIEGIIYLVLLHRVNAQGQPFIHPDDLREFSETEIHWNRLRQRALDRNYVDQATLTAMEQIRKLGNFAAHNGEQIMRGIAGGIQTPYRISISPEEAYHSLNVVREFILTVIEKWVGAEQN